MRREFTMVSWALWHEERFRRLTTNQKLLYLYIYLGPNMNFTGCCVLPMGYALHDLNWAECEYREALHGVIEAGLIMFDEATAEVFVAAFEAQFALSAKQKAGIEAAAKLISSEHLRQAVIKATQSRPLPKKRPIP